MKASVQAILNDQALLCEAIAVVLETVESSLTEFELIQTLNQQGWQFSTQAADTHALFISHFLIFHCLYQLQERYWEEEGRSLEIHTLAIKLHPSFIDTENDIKSQQNTAQTMVNTSADEQLKAYYLDLKHLEQSSEDSVNALLNQFWARFIAEGDATEALAVFDLTHPTTAEAVKHRYRQLAMKHHPDRGGDASTFQAINRAFGVLQRVYP